MGKIVGFSLFDALPRAGRELCSWRTAGCLGWHRPVRYRDEGTYLTRTYSSRVDGCELRSCEVTFFAPRMPEVCTDPRTSPTSTPSVPCQVGRVSWVLRIATRYEVALESLCEVNNQNKSQSAEGADPLAVFVPRISLIRSNVSPISVDLPP